MNTRTRQIIKAMLTRKNPDWFAMLRVDGRPGRRVVSVPRGEVAQYKARYGDRIVILYEEREEANT